MSNELPKILTVTINAWRDNSGINTLTGILSGWDSDKVAQIYTRSKLPHTSVCNRFFQISESRIIHSILNRRIHTGVEVSNQVEMYVSAEEQEEIRRYKRRGKVPSILYIWARELVWLFGKWRTLELDCFIDSYSPDVLFIPIYPTIYMGRIQQYIIKRAKKPFVSYIADDNYSYLACEKNPLSILHRFILRRHIRNIIKNSKQVFVIAPKQKEEYDKVFGVNSLILTKGVDYSQSFYKEKPVNSPIKMIYTGKLIIGRWKSLALITEAMGQINKDKIKIELDIYTTDMISKEQDKALNRNGCHIKGALTQEQVRLVQQDADILVFVESLEKKYRNTARLSFSTKITDYLSSGKCIFAIGSRDIAPIDYFERYDSAVTASSPGEVVEKLQMLVNHSEMILEYGKKSFECGVKHHDKRNVQKAFHDVVCRVAN